MLLLFILHSDGRRLLCIPTLQVLCVAQLYLGDYLPHSQHPKRKYILQLLDANLEQARNVAAIIKEKRNMENATTPPAPITIAPASDDPITDSMDRVEDSPDKAGTILNLAQQNKLSYNDGEHFSLHLLVEDVKQESVSVSIPVTRLIDRASPQNETSSITASDPQCNVLNDGKQLAEYASDTKAPDEETSTQIVDKNECEQVMETFIDRAATQKAQNADSDESVILIL